MELAEAGINGRPVTILVDGVTSARAAANVEASFSRGLPRFHAMPALGHATGPVALVGGGPSLRSTLDELARFSFTGTIISCGSCHDHLIENGIIPRFHVNGEPDMDGVMKRWMQALDLDITYLIASQCPPEMFDMLDGYDVRVWHLAVPPGPNEPDFRGEPTVPGAHFILGRAWPIAAIMGYRDIHFFGFDCSFPENCTSQHAYAYDWTKEEPCGVTCDGRRFISTPSLLSQLDEFCKMGMRANDMFKITIHGDGLAAAILRGQ